MTFIIVCAACAVMTTHVNATEVDPPRIRQLIISPSAILTDEELYQVQDAFVGETLTPGVIGTITSQLNELYASKGYIAQAVILPQTSEDGSIEVTLVEGRVGQIRIKENQSTQDDFFIRRLSLEEGSLVHIDQLDDDVTFMNRTNDVAVRIELVPGEGFGESDLVIFVQEPANSQFVVAIDGSGRDESGQYNTSLVWKTPSLTKYRDPLSISLSHAGGTNSASLSYNYPVSRFGTRLGASYDVNAVEFRDGDYAPVGLRVESDSGSVTLSHPFLVSPNLIILSSVEWHTKQSKTYLSDSHLTGSESKAGVAAMTVESVTPHRSWTMNTGVRVGHARTPNDSEVHFTKYTAGVQYIGPAGTNARWNVRASLQYSPIDLLPSDEQFHLGGESTVRGYKKGAISGDDGFAVNAEYHWPWHKQVAGYVFADYGGVFPFKGDDEPQTKEEFLTSVGVGFNWQLGTSFQLNLHYGLPLGEPPEKSGAASGRVQFKLQAVF